MKDTLSLTHDPICGMVVDKTTEFHTQCDGMTYFFCSELCRKTFLTPPTGPKSKNNSECCGSTTACTPR